MRVTDSVADPSTGTDPVIETVELDSRWPCVDPFLFCAHHVDDYPEANDRLGPASALDGREIGRDFAGIDGWRMYHGSDIPGFPGHPHRGFETVTWVRRGLIDHSDSLGATARYGRGDVQWLTAGAGIVHAEMFPLVDAEARNPLELFQIWLNLPSEDKLVDPHFTMLWDEDVPRREFRDAADRLVEVTVIAGVLDGVSPAGAAAEVVGVTSRVGPGHLAPPVGTRRHVGPAAGPGGHGADDLLLRRRGAHGRWSPAAVVDRGLAARRRAGPTGQRIG